MVKKNIKKKKIYKSYIFYGILVFLGIVLALFFIYGLTSPKSKISGKAILEEYIDEDSCIVAGYTWNNLINETCITIPDCVECAEGCLTEGEVCESNCVKEYTETLCELGCQEICGENETECVVCEPNCVKEYTEILCKENCILEGDLCGDCQETCQNCSEKIIGGRCIGGDFCGDGNVDIGEECDEGENNGQDCNPDCDNSCTYCSSDCFFLTIEGVECQEEIVSNETTKQNITSLEDEVIEKNINTLTDEERKIFVEKFGNVSAEIIKNELVEGGREITFKLKDYFMVRFYDSALSEKDLKLQIESEKIKWFKDIINTLSQK